jgi:hypothetical protein
MLNMHFDRIFRQAELGSGLFAARSRQQHHLHGANSDGQGDGWFTCRQKR